MSPRNRGGPSRRAGALIVAASAFGLVHAHAASFQDIYDFKGTYNGGDGQGPQSGLTVDSAGRLVGTTPSGGTTFEGVVYRLTPPAQPGAPWTEQVLYDFASAGQSTGDSVGPVVLQGDGTILGTAAYGGRKGAGIVYRIDQSGGQWTMTVLHSFTLAADGADPYSGITAGPSGLLYGPTVQDGDNGDGTIYSISPFGDQVEYQRQSQTDLAWGASRPTAIGTTRLVYTTTNGGPDGQGTVMAAQQVAPGRWHASTLYSFASGDDASSPFPTSPLLPGPHRTLYGCAGGGVFGLGAVYQLTPPASAGAAWTESVLYSFGAQPNDPSAPAGHCYITAGPGGRIVGTTSIGGDQQYGALFELDPPAQAGSAWTETVLHNFTGKKLGFFFPSGVPLLIGNTYYGTAASGGAGGVAYSAGGGVWSFTP